MAFTKTLAHRFLTMAKIRASPTSHNPPSILRRLLPASGEDHGILRRLLQRRRIFQSAVPPDRIAIPTGDRLLESLRRINGDRVRLDVLAPPPEKSAEGLRISAEEVRKVLKAWQMEAVRARLRATARSCVSYSEFLKICCEATSSDQGLGVAKSLDESGAVIVLGDFVFLRPDQVAKAIESVIPLPMVPTINDPRINELREMEKRKSNIDKKANAQVRRELWCGLGFMVLQTAGLMRLTFWELSWDVMEPICFGITSIYFMAGYTFFLRTSRDPSFEGFFETRFSTKQRQLMKAANFDSDRFNELRKAFLTPPLAFRRTSFNSS